MDYILLSIGIVLLVLGILGCILPIIPGPPLSFLGMLVVHFTHFATYTSNQLILFGTLAIIVTALDYIIPIIGTKRFGGSKAGQWGATIGMIIGMIFLGPLGLILGPFIGAVIGELTQGRSSNEAFRSGLGSLLGFLAGVGIKLATSILITIYFVKGIV